MIDQNDVQMATPTSRDTEKLRFSQLNTAAPKRLEILFVRKKGRIDIEKLAIFVPPVY